jgi:hypothetical protein
MDHVQALAQPDVKPNPHALAGQPPAHPVPVSSARPAVIDEKGKLVSSKPGAQPVDPPVKAAPQIKSLPGHTAAAPPASASKTAAHATTAKPAGKNAAPTAAAQPATPAATKPGKTTQQPAALPASAAPPAKTAATPATKPASQPAPKTAAAPAAKPAATPSATAGLPATRAAAWQRGGSVFLRQSPPPTVRKNHKKISAGGTLFSFLDHTGTNGGFSHRQLSP